MLCATLEFDHDTYGQKICSSCIPQHPRCQATHAQRMGVNTADTTMVYAKLRPSTLMLTALLSDNACMFVNTPIPPPPPTQQTDVYTSAICTMVAV